MDVRSRGQSLFHVQKVDAQNYFIFWDLLCTFAPCVRFSPSRYESIHKYLQGKSLPFGGDNKREYEPWSFSLVNVVYPCANLCPLTRRRGGQGGSIVHLQRVQLCSYFSHQLLSMWNTQGDLIQPKQKTRDVYRLHLCGTQKEQHGEKTKLHLLRANSFAISPPILPCSRFQGIDIVCSSERL